MPSKYRIVRREWFDLHNVKHVQFEPQSRFLWVFWCGFVVEDCGFTWNRRFDTIQEAEDFIREVDRMNGDTKRSTVVAEYRC